ncbi:MAG: endonuclease III [Verrucomicrobia bacterium GWF2_51_19]|nr:MAG: endonuclease III [Verrucomicrobia bacterium GWF2_51_19]HCJ11598.1 endonuclease III [Opitutae bacterium]
MVTTNIAIIEAILDRLYPNPEVSLKYESLYTLLLAVLLSARCTDKRVNEVTPRLFALAKTPAAMAAIPVEEIRAIIRPCGLSNSKAKAISGLSKILCERYSGEVPQTLEELETLPGVGHKTASVVASQLGIDAFPVDTHIHRLAKRWKLSSGRSVVQTERDLKRLFPKDRWHIRHLQMIHYGREYCTARGCKGSCEICKAL